MIETKSAGEVEISEENFDSFFTDFEIRCRQRRRKTQNQGEALFTALALDKEQTTADLFLKFTRSSFNQGRYTPEDLSRYRSIFTKKLDRLVAQIKEETITSFTNYFEGICYFNLPTASSNDYARGQIRHELIIPSGELHTLRTHGRKRFEGDLFKEFAASGAVSRWYNIYVLSKKNLEFLKPVITQLVDELIVEIGKKYGTDYLDKKIV